ncbi:MAG TPA: polysaccharide biosynthesis/export family protein [Gemmatimonadaceae bacterium]|nr:polysaccharide biosynthesis/export family protein [Gemmatimonadaceae bacterium]
MNIRLLALLAALAAVAPSVSAAQSPQPTPERVTLAPGDMLRIAVWREPDMSGDFLVDELGIVTLPLLGKINVREIPLTGLRDTLIKAYSVQLRNPTITVTPLRRVFVLGEVTKPGLYAADPTISLAGVIALAGGAGPEGDLRHIRVVRDGTVINSRVTAGTTLGLTDIRSNDQIFVDRRSWFDRNSTLLLSGLVSITTIALTLLLR